MNKREMPEARLNAGDHVLIDLNFISDWVTGLCEFYGPIVERIVERNRAKTLQC